MENFNEFKWLTETASSKRKDTLKQLRELQKLVEESKSIDQTSIIFEDA